MSDGNLIFRGNIVLSAVNWNAMEGHEFRVRVAAPHVRSQLAGNLKDTRNKAEDGHFLRPVV